MKEWTELTDRPGYRCKTVQRGNAKIIIFRPVQSESEAAKAEEKARTALESVMREHYIAKGERTSNSQQTASPQGPALVLGLQNAKSAGLYGT